MKHPRPFPQRHGQQRTDFQCRLYQRGAGPFQTGIRRSADLIWRNTPYFYYMDFVDRPEIGTQPDMDRSNHFKYDQQLYSLYATYSRSFGNFSFRAACAPKKPSTRRKAWAWKTKTGTSFTSKTGMWSSTGLFFPVPFPEPDVQVRQQQRRFGQILPARFPPEQPQPEPHPDVYRPAVRDDRQPLPRPFIHRCRRIEILPANSTTDFSTSRPFSATPPI